MGGRNLDAFMQKDEGRVNSSKGYPKPFKAKKKKIKACNLRITTRILKAHSMTFHRDRFIHG